ncbi:MAG: dihydroneopterin triphosphate diphosphatase [Chromatiales bacterium]|nr:dihydroneopterin triphosphate diphosphatase [Chromatiales bacterium]
MFRYKRPESVLVVVYTATGEVLVLRRCQPPDFWQSVTGSLRWEEADPLDAARRELYEETGLGDEVEVVGCGTVNRFPILPPWRHRYAPDVVENLEHVFRVLLPEQSAHRAQSRRTQQIRMAAAIDSGDPSRVLDQPGRHPAITVRALPARFAGPLIGLLGMETSTVMKDEGISRLNHAK